ncbi:MAG TPA: amino acid permease [Ignavibacteriaceae bacterium]|nr:amino acid permease [Ignavibacteriaceae bacterium]
MNNKNSGFKQGLNLFDSSMIVIGSMIGSGIFIVSADIARTTGSAGMLLLVWIITGIVTLIAALSYGELAALMPEAGGQYVYLNKAYNPLTGFLYGWTFFLIIQTGTIAAVAVAFAKFTAVLIPWFGENNILLNIIGLKISSAQLLAIFSISILTFINYKGLREGKIVQDTFTISKTIVIIGLIFLAFTIGSNASVIKENFTDIWNAERLHLLNGKIDWIEHLSGFSLIAAVGVAMVGSLFSSDAWNNITFTAGEVQNPKRNIPLSLFIGTLTVTIIYLLVNISYLFILPIHGNPDGSTIREMGIQFAANDRVGTAAAYSFLGDTSAYIMAALIMISTFGCNNGLILAGARVLYAMSKDNLFFKKAGELNKNAVPGAALIMQAVWASILCLSGTYGQLLDYVIFAVLLFYAFTIAGIFILRKKMPDAPRPYKAIGYPVVPLLYIVFAITMCVILLINKPQYTWPGLFIVMLGIPVYFVYSRINKKLSK